MDGMKRDFMPFFASGKLKPLIHKVFSFDELPNGGYLHTGGGEITIGSAGGALEASTGGGDIRIRRTTGDAAVSTGAGDVTITVVNADGSVHTIEAWSGLGRIVVELPADIDARFELESALYLMDGA